MLHGHRPHLLTLLLSAIVMASTAMPARAQLVGGPPRGAVPLTIPTLLPTVQRLPRVLPDAVPEVLSRARNIQVDRVLKRHPEVLDVDPVGAPVVRSEVVAIDPTAEALQKARAAGFTVGDERTLEELGLRLVVLRGPDGVTTSAALERLRQLDPSGSYDFNHLYFGSGSTAVQGAARATATPPLASAIRVGLIDSGVARDHPALAGVDVTNWGCDGKPVADAHGTAVASLLVGAADGHAPPGTTLFAADIYCGRPTGGAVTGYAEAMAWLARQDVGVINLSLVGPHNALLQRATAALAARGHVLVAAVGNDGPASPPLFPAAYPDVIGVTAVDPRDRALPEAVHGSQVDFAARGSKLRAARPDGGWTTVRGTSFAAPLVARAAALRMGEPGSGRAERVRAGLTETARDLGADGRDDTYGFGLVEALPAIAAGGAD